MAYQPMAVHAGELPWTVLKQDQRRFQIILNATVVALMAIALMVPFLPLPKVARPELEAVPPRLAKIILEQRAQAQPLPPPPQPQRPAIPPPPPATPLARPQPEPRQPLTPAEQQARKRVQNKGLAGLTQELAAIADSSNIGAMAPARVTAAGKTSEAATVDTRILAAAGGRRSSSSGGVRPQAHVGTVETLKLEDNRKETAQNLLASKGETPPGAAREGVHRSTRGSSGRAEEEVAVIMDKYKSLLYAIYNRARRTNPGLKGKIVLVITILPSGQVANVVTKSSELTAPDLEAALLARVRQFNFGATQGETLTVTVPVEFLPS